MINKSSTFFLVAAAAITGISAHNAEAQFGYGVKKVRQRLLKSKPSDRQGKQYKRLVASQRGVSLRQMSSRGTSP